MDEIVYAEMGHMLKRGIFALITIETVPHPSGLEFSIICTYTPFYSSHNLQELAGGMNYKRLDWRVL